MYYYFLFEYSRERRASKDYFEYLNKIDQQALIEKGLPLNDNPSKYIGRELNCGIVSITTQIN